MLAADASMAPYRGNTTSKSCPRAASARGNAPITSPSPPVLMKGAASDATNRIFTLRLRLTEEGGGLLRRGGVDEEAAAPLEAGRQREDRPQLQVPVIPVRGRLAQRQCVQIEIVGRLAQRKVELAQREAQRLGEPAQLGRRALLEDRAVLAGQDEQLERPAGGPRRQGHEPVGLQHDARALPRFLGEDVAEDAPLLFLVVLLRAGELLLQLGGDQGKRDDLRVRVAERRAGGRSAVLEEEHAAQAHVPREIEHALLRCTQHLLDLLGAL